MCCILWSFILKFLSNHPSMLFMPLPYISTNIQGQPSNWVKMAPSTLESALGVWRKTYGFGWQASSLDTMSNMDLASSDHSSHGRTYSSCCRQRPLIYKRGRCGLLCDSPSKSLQGRHARLRSGGPTPAIVHKKFGKPWAWIILQIVSDLALIFQFCYGKSSLSQKFSVTNLG